MCGYGVFGGVDGTGELRMVPRKPELANSIFSYFYKLSTICDSASLFTLQSTSPIASLFISLHHNVSGVEPTRETPKGEPFFYESGWKDACAVFFYSLVCIVMHAILQEYFLDVSINWF